MTTVRVTKNLTKNGYEIKFEAKPGDKVRSYLKTNGFRWSRRLGHWYAKDCQEVEEAVETFELRLAKADCIHVERVETGTPRSTQHDPMLTGFELLIEGGQ